jgi:glycosyltransferase involved in cell wall biosynthesis
MQRDKALTVVIPTCNEIDSLPKLVHCLERQTFTGFTVIVVDNHSVDGTRRFCQTKGIKLIDGGHPGKARNLGAKAASTKYILFLDADVVIPDNFIKEAMKCMGELGADLISFELISYEKIPLVDFLFNITVLYFRVAEFFGFSHGVGAALLVKKNVHVAVDGFDESITVAEDHDYTNRISKAYKYVFLREPKVTVSARRLVNEGIVRYSLKCIFIEIYRVLSGEVRGNRIKYL